MGSILSLTQQGRGRAALWFPLLLALAVRGFGAAAAFLPEPPPLPPRSIAPSKTPPRGVTVELTNQGVRASLFLPDGWRAPADGRADIVVHFHTVAWFTIQEHVRLGSTRPLLNFALGEGSATYARPFLEPARFQDWLGLVATELEQRGAPPGTRIVRADVSSFSAGYGAVREILKLETNRAVLQRLVLCDSLYGGLAETNAPYPRRAVAREHVEPWLPFARAAVRGEKTFLITTSDIETARYASTRECADAVAAGAGAQFADVATNACAAARDPDFPLRRRADAGRFHVWQYAGTNGPAHLTHVRHLTDLWRALDAAEAGRRQ